MSEQSFVSSVSSNNDSKLLWYILGGVVVLAVVLGAIVFWYGNNLAKDSSTNIKPSAIPRVVSPSVAPIINPSPAIEATPIASQAATINQVGVQAKSVVFPKAGRVALYFLFFNGDATTKPYEIELTSTKGKTLVTAPASKPASPKKMQIIDTGLTVAANETVTIQAYDFGDLSKPSVGWLAPVNNNTCGSPTHLRPEPEIFEWMRTTINATGEPIVSEQCWSDWEINNDIDYNDLLMVFTYVKPTVSPSPSASISSSPSPSPSPSIKAATPTPSPILAASPTPAQSTRAATVDTSEGVPVTGVIEDTIKAAGIGIVMFVLGLLLL